METEEFDITHHATDSRIGKNVKVVIKSSYDGMRGVGLQYFGVEGVPGNTSLYFDS